MFSRNVEFEIKMKTKWNKNSNYVKIFLEKGLVKQKYIIIFVSDKKFIKDFYFFMHD